MRGLRGALGVRVSDGRTDRIVTQHCRGLRFTKVAPGGHQSLSFTMTLPRDSFTDLGPQDRAYVYDARTARTIIEGYTENPTPSDGPAGQQYAISAIGGMALLSDQSEALVYVTRDLGQFERDQNAAADSDINTAKDETYLTEQRLRTQFSGGSVVATGGGASATNFEFDRANMNLGGVRFGAFYSGKPDVGFAEDFSVAGAGIVYTRTMSNVGQTLELWVGTNWPTGEQVFGVRLRRTGLATNIADDQSWTNWVAYSAIGQRMDRYGTLLTGATALASDLGSVKASQVAEDLLGRLLTFCDPGTAQIDPTSFLITNLAYNDGVKAATVFGDLGNYEPDFLWEILETLDNGKHRFNYRAWPTTPRYEVSVRDGWQQKGSDADLCNRVLVRWTDANGKAQVTPVTAAGLGLTGLGLPVDELEEQGRIKDAEPITLPDGQGSAENALRIGGQVLRDKISPPKAGTITIRRPIMDHLTGNRVMPWEVEPGYVCRVRETGDDLRITQVDYDDDSVSSTLTLGTPVPTVEQRVARLFRAA